MGGLLEVCECSEYFSVESVTSPEGSVSPDHEWVTAPLRPPAPVHEVGSGVSCEQRFDL